MTTVKDALAAGLLELEALGRLQPLPVPPLGYGTDLFCDSDLREDMPEIDDTLALSQALVRRLDCPRGGLPDDPDYGFDLRAYCNRGVTAEEVRSLAGRVRAELSKDDRIESLTVRVAPSPRGSELAVTVAVVARDPSLGGFTLVLAVSSSELLLEEVRRATV